MVSADATGTGAEVLALLRGDAAARPRFDPGLAGGLRAWLEDAAYDVVTARGEHAAPLFLGPRQLLGSHDEHGGDGYGWGDDDAWRPTDGLVLSRLVHALVAPTGAHRRDQGTVGRRARCTARRTAT